MREIDRADGFALFTNRISRVARRRKEHFVQLSGSRRFTNMWNCILNLNQRQINSGVYHDLGGFDVPHGDCVLAIAEAQRNFDLMRLAIGDIIHPDFESWLEILLKRDFSFTDKCTE